MWLHVLLVVVVAANAVSIGLRLDSSIPLLVDNIVSYAHLAAVFLNCLFPMKRRYGLWILCALVTVGTVLPNQCIFIRSVSLCLVIESLKSRDVVRLASRVLPLTGWMALVMFCFLWTLVLLTNVFFDFGNSNTWIFVKPWLINDTFEYFDVKTYFGSSVLSFLTFLQVVTLDHHLSHIVRPIITAYPAMFVFFTCIVVIGAFGIVNVLLGLVVRENVLLENARAREYNKNKDKESLYLQLIAQGIVHRVKRFQNRLKSLLALERVRAVIPSSVSAPSDS